MMRALFSGVTGLRSHQTKMDVIGNNISNVNTLGFKKSAANFADLYSETTAAATAPNASKGGTNAAQVGLGVSVNAVVVKHTPGAASYTGNTLDLAIAGDGYFSVRTSADGQINYTRAGNFSVSSNGSLVTASGYFVQCFNSMYNGGNDGTISSTSGVSNNSTTGFNSFTFDDNGAAIVNAASGNYTMQLNSSNKVDVYKNGVLYQSNLDIEYQDANSDWQTLTGIITPNTKYRVVIPDFGTINFESDGHSLSTGGMKNKDYGSLLNTSYVETDHSSALQKLLPVGTYSIGKDPTAKLEGDKVDGSATILVTDLPEGLTWANEKKDGGVTVSTYDIGQVGYYDYQLLRKEYEVNTGEVDEQNQPIMEPKTVVVLQYKLAAGTDTDAAAAGASGTGTNVPGGGGLQVGTSGTPGTITGSTGSTEPILNTEDYINVMIGIKSADPSVKLTVADETLLQNTTYQLTTPLGNVQFTTKSGSNVYNPAVGVNTPENSKVENGDDSSYTSLLDGVLFQANAPKTEGSGEKFTTGMLYIDTLLRGASINVANNDGFTTGATMGDLIINQDLFQDVQVTEDGAVVATLKRATTAEELRSQGITGAIDLGAGERVILGYVAMASFSNAEGLEKIGTNLYQATTNSGRASYGLAGEGGVGSLSSSSLEMSNVDLSEEMVNMITTQRGFQANSRIITVTDTMLEELINLKR